MKAEQTEGLPEKLRGADGESVKDDGTSEAQPPSSGSGDGAFREHAAGSASRRGPRSRVLRLLYWALWFVVAPVALACVFVWALTPANGVEHGGVLGWVQTLVREQPVPVLIVVFTLFEMALWAARHHLPLTRYAHPPVRPDLPANLRAPFDRARTLLDEADMIYARHRTQIVRDLTAKERERLRADLDELRGTMERPTLDPDAFIEALGKAESEVDVRLGRWRKSEVREYVEAILLAITVAFGLRAFVFEAFKIPSGSMIPTLQVGDHIFVNKFSYGPAIPFTHKRLWSNMPPHRGEVMVFAFPEHPEQDFIKRVIAVPGDKLEAKNGHPWINGWEVPSCLVGTYVYNDFDSPLQHHEGDLFIEYLGSESYLTFYDRAAAFPEYQGPFVAKPGEVWVMGDNRNNSHDSRMWWGGRGGGVPFENIRGRALFVWLSVSENGVDGSRFLAPVMGRPKLPPAMKGLEPGVDKCLRERPPIEKTTPPNP
jgi:signal peptidase I